MKNRIHFIPQLALDGDESLLGLGEKSLRDPGGLINPCHLCLSCCCSRIIARWWIRIRLQRGLGEKSPGIPSRRSVSHGCECSYHFNWHVLNSALGSSGCCLPPSATPFLMTVNWESHWRPRNKRETEDFFWPLNWGVSLLFVCLKKSGRREGKASPQWG